MFVLLFHEWWYNISFDIISTAFLKYLITFELYNTMK